MNKKIMAVTVMLCMAFAVYYGALYAQGGTTDTITITATASGTLSVSVSPNTWDMGTLNYGDKNDSSSPLSGYFTITNDGTVDAKIEIKGADGANWTLGATAGYNQFAINATTDTQWGNADDVTLTTSYQTLISSLSAQSGSNTEDIDLGFHMPTGGTQGATDSITVTLQASQP